MPPRGWWHRASGILKAIGDIEAHIADITREAFLEDSLTRQAVQWNLMIIGEAVAGLPQEVRDREPDVPWASIRVMRNILAHEYFGVDLNIVWTAASGELDPLREAVLRLLDANAG